MIENKTLAAMDAISQKIIYLDHNASTPLDPRVLNTMMPFLTDQFANAGSPHRLGHLVMEAVENARQSIMTYVGAKRGRVVFTSTATEAINLALMAFVASINPAEKKHIVTQPTEHSAVLETCKRLEMLGWEISFCNVDSWGTISPDEVKRLIRPNTAAVVIQHGNNEIGTIHPIAAIGTVCKSQNVLFVVDAAQTAGKLPINVVDCNIDALIISGHKMYGPKGVAALYQSQRADSRHQHFIYGGGQEFGIRSGTLNVPGIIGLAEAFKRCLEGGLEEASRLRHLAATFLYYLKADVDGITLNGPMSERLPGNINLTIEGVEHKLLLDELYHKIAISPSSTCSGRTRSHVLEALGLPLHAIRTSVRLSFGRFNTNDEMLQASQAFIAAIKKIRSTLKTA